MKSTLIIVQKPSSRWRSHDLKIIWKSAKLKHSKKWFSKTLNTGTNSWLMEISSLKPSALLCIPFIASRCLMKKNIWQIRHSSASWIKLEFKYFLIKPFGIYLKIQKCKLNLKTWHTASLLCILTRNNFTLFVPK